MLFFYNAFLQIYMFLKCFTIHRSLVTTLQFEYHGIFDLKSSYSANVTFSISASDIKVCHSSIYLRVKLNGPCSVYSHVVA